MSLMVFAPVGASLALIFVRSTPTQYLKLMKGQTG